MPKRKGAEARGKGLARQIATLATGISGGSCRIYGISPGRIEFYRGGSAIDTAAGSSHLRAVDFGSLAESHRGSLIVPLHLPSPRCPACRSGCVRRSRRKGMLERTLLTAAFVRPFRCVECGWRFYRPFFHPSFETQQAVFASRMTPRYSAGGSGAESVPGGDAARLNLRLG